MLDIISRALRHPFDYSGVLKSSTLTFKKHRHEHDQIHSFIFEFDKDLTWKAGQHSLFVLPEGVKSGKAWRPFSVASAPHEGVIQIGTTIPEKHSDFKNGLLQLASGDTIHMYGPYGEFYLRPHMKRIVGIAGGIGITPFRSLIADAVHHRRTAPIHLIYAAKDEHTYKEELDEWQNDHAHLTIEYVHDPDQVNLALSEAIDTYKNNAHYFISGAPGMIKAIEKNCHQQGVYKIVNDPFKGY